MAEKKPTGNRRFTPEQELAIVADYDAKMSSPQIGAKWGCGHWLLAARKMIAAGVAKGILEAGDE